MSGSNSKRALDESVVRSLMQDAKVIWARTFPEQVRRAFILPERKAGMKGYVLLFNISLDTLKGADWDGFRSVWLRNYASDNNDDRVKRVLILIPTDKNGRFHRWTSTAALAETCPECSDHPEDRAMLRRLVAKTFVASVPHDAGVTVPDQYAFAVYTTCSSETGRALEKCSKANDLTDGQLAELAEGTKLVLGAGIGAPFSTTRENGHYEYVRLIMIEPGKQRLPMDECIVADHMKLFKDLWMHRAPRLPVRANGRSARRAASDFADQHRSGVVPHATSLLCAFGSNYIAMDPIHQTLRERKDAATAFASHMTSEFRTTEDGEFLECMEKVVPMRVLPLSRYRVVGICGRWSEGHRKQLRRFVDELGRRLTSIRNGNRVRGLLLWGRSSSGKNELIKQASLEFGLRRRLKLLPANEADARYASRICQRVRSLARSGPVLAFVDEVDAASDPLVIKAIIGLPNSQNVLFVAAGSSGSSWSDLKGRIEAYDKSEDLLTRLDLDAPHRYALPHPTILDRIIVAAFHAYRHGFTSVEKRLLAFLLAHWDLTPRDIVTTIEGIRPPGRKGGACLGLDLYLPADHPQRSVFVDTFTSVLDKLGDEAVALRDD